jgi:hypothetical protein
MNLEFISALRAAGVSLSLQGNTVGFSGPRGALSPELMGVLRSNKDAIREFLRRLPADGKASRSAPAITKTPREGVPHIRTRRCDQSCGAHARARDLSPRPDASATIDP